MLTIGRNRRRDHALRQCWFDFAAIQRHQVHPLGTACLDSKEYLLPVSQECGTKDEVLDRRISFWFAGTRRQQNQLRWNTFRRHRYPFLIWRYRPWPSLTEAHSRHTANAANVCIGPSSHCPSAFGKGDHFTIGRDCTHQRPIEPRKITLLIAAG